MYCEIDRKQGARMIRIAICDDESKYLKKMEESIKIIMQKEQIQEYKIDLFSSAEDLEMVLIGQEIYQVIFLDINMPQMSGLELAQRIRERDKDVILVFTTAFLDYAIEGYRLNVLRFLLKDMLEQLLPECMDAVLRKLQLYVKTISCPFIEGVKEILIADICYIESQKHKLIFHVLHHEQKIYTLYDKLDNFDEKLEAYDFIRVHKSFLVNIMYIKSIGNYKVKMQEGELLPVPREKFQQVKEKYYSIKGDLL